MLPEYPFQASEEQLAENLDYYVSTLIASLQSFFLVMPKGRDFLTFTRFEGAYEVLREVTNGFADFTAQNALVAIGIDPLVLVVLRTIVGMSPPELANIASIPGGTLVDQATARRLDKRAKEGKPLLAGTNDATKQAVQALVQTAVQLIVQGAPDVVETVIHRLDKADTRRGLDSVRQLATSGVSYAKFLYERLLGRAFATHRDAVSEQVGAVLENALKFRLETRSIPYHETRMAERFEDMDQAPDFLVPDPVRPAVVIEAKLAEDDGTARDKVTRVQHLAELRDHRLRAGVPAFEVVACVDGRGFGIRREDVKKLLLATKGKLFTLRTVDLVDRHTALGLYARGAP